MDPGERVAVGGPRWGRVPSTRAVWQCSASGTSMAGLAPETAHCAVVHGLRCPVEPVLCAALGRHSPSPPPPPPPPPPWRDRQVLALLPTGSDYSRLGAGQPPTARQPGQSGERHEWSQNGAKRQPQTGRYLRYIVLLHSPQSTPPPAPRCRQAVRHRPPPPPPPSRPLREADLTVLASS